MNFVRKYVAIAALGILACAGAAGTARAETPDGLVTRIGRDILAAVNAERQPGNQRRLFSIVDRDIVPYVDIERMTALAVGAAWRNATQDQQAMLVRQFRELLILTYMGALDRARGMNFAVSPSRVSPADTDAVVRSRIGPAHGPATELDYRLEKTAMGWKIYDVNVAGSWLISIYRGRFAVDINRSGIDGLIPNLTTRNGVAGARLR